MKSLLLISIGFILAIVIMKISANLRTRQEIEEMEKSIMAPHLMTVYKADEELVIGRNSMPGMTSNSKHESELSLLTEEEQAIFAFNATYEPQYEAKVIFEEEVKEKDVKDEEIDYLNAVFSDKPKTKFVENKKTDEEEHEPMNNNQTTTFVETPLDDETSQSFFKDLSQFVNMELNQVTDDVESENEKNITDELNNSKVERIFDDVENEKNISDEEFIKQVTNFAEPVEATREISPVRNVVLTLDEFFDEENVDAQFLKFAPLFADEYEHQLCEGVSGFRSWIVQVVGKESNYIHVTDGTGRLWLDVENFSNKDIQLKNYLAIDAQDGEIKTLTVLNIEDYKQANYITA